MIEAVQLTKTFGSFTAADRISFRIGRGEVFGLLGPNGAGKSTTFKMMCGLLRPTSGVARVAGIDLYRSSSSARARLGYMAQKFSLYGDLSVRQNLEFFAGIYGLRRHDQASGHRPHDCLVRSRMSSWLAAPACFPWASSSGWHWPARSCTNRRCSSSTSRPRGSIR